MSKLQHIVRFAVLALSIAAVHPALADTIYNATGGAPNGEERCLTRELRPGCASVQKRPP